MAYNVFLGSGGKSIKTVASVGVTASGRVDNVFISSATEPTTRENGGSLVEGDQWWDTSTLTLSIYINGDFSTVSVSPDALVKYTDSIGQISDVDLTTPATSGQVLKWNGSAFVPGDADIDHASIGSLADVTIFGTPTERQALLWNATGGYWYAGDQTIRSVNGLTGEVVLNADNIDDTSTTHKFVSQVEKDQIASSLQPGDNVSQLVNDSLYLTDITNEGLGDLNDVNTTGASVGHYVRYNGTSWTSQTINYTDIAGRPVDVSDLNNDLNFIDATQAPIQTVNGQTGNITINTTTLGLGNVDNTSDVNKPISTQTQAALDLKADLVAGKVPTSQLPALAITEFLGTVSSEAAMLALVGQPGDWCLRDDQAVAYVLTANDYTLLSSWTSITAAGSAVTTVNSQVGDVTLSYTDVNAASSDQGLLADSAVQPGDAISTLNNDTGFITNVSGSPIGELSNVTVSSAISGKVLRYNGSNWVDAVLAYTDLSGTPTNVSTFTNDSAYISNITNENIGDLNDVTISPRTTGEVLRWNGTHFTNSVLAYTDLSGTPTNVSTFTNDSNYITSAQAPIQTVNGQSGTVVLDADDIDDSLSTHKFATAAQLGLADTSVQPGDNISTLTNDVAFITSASVNSLTDTNLGILAAGQVLRWSGTDWVNIALGYADLTGTPTALSDFTNDLNFIDSAGAPVQSVNTQTGSVVLDADDIDDTSTTHKFATSVQLGLADTSVQPGDGVSTLTNDSGYISNINSENLGDLSDVTFSGVSVNGEFLRYNGTNWTGTLLVAGDIPDISATYALSVDQTETDTNVNDLVTLSGVAENSANLGAFTGTTISDLNNVKGALQQLETAVELKSNDTKVDEIDQNVDDLVTLAGVGENTTNLGVFGGSTVADNLTIKQAMQSLETAVETKADQTSLDTTNTNLTETDTNVDDLITLSGVAENVTGLGTFTGSTITTNSDIKTALQELETELETKITSAGAPVQSVAGKTGTVSLVKGDVGLGNVDNTADLDKPISTLTQTALNAKADLVGGLVPTSQLPPIAITEYKGTAANDAAMVLLTGEVGDWCIRTDTNTTRIIISNDGSSVSDWQEVAYGLGNGNVVSINGQTGIVVLTASDVNALPTAGGTMTGNILMSGTETVDGRDLSVDGAKLDGIAAGADVSPTVVSAFTNDANYITSAGAPVQTVNAQTGTVVLDADDIDDTTTLHKFVSAADLTKLAGIETGATADQTAADIRGLGFFDVTNDGALSGLDADLLDGQEGSYYAVAADLTETDTNTDDLVTLSGVAENSTNLGTFPGSLITDNATIKTALTELESAISSNTDADTVDGLHASQFLRSDADDTTTGDITISKADPTLNLTNTTVSEDDFAVKAIDGGLYITNVTDLRDDLIIDGAGVATFAGNLNANSGLDVTGNITVTGTVDGRDVATDGTTLDTLNTTTVPEIDQNVDDLVTLSGVVENATNLGTFTGSVITDNVTVKAALQDLETALELNATDAKVDEIDQNVDDLVTLSGMPENSTNLGTFTGSTIANGQTVKGALQFLETEVELKANTSSLATVATTGAYSDLSGTPTNVSQFTNDSAYISDITGENLGDLADVSIGGAVAGQFLKYNGTNWIPSNAGVFVSATAPTSPTPVSGDLWWDTNSGILFIYYTDTDTSQWVDATGGTTGTEETISKSTMQSVVAASTSFADFQSRIAAL